MKKYLGLQDLPMVKDNKLRELIKEAWSKGEEVPYGVIFLHTNRILSAAEIARIKQLVVERKINDY